MDMNNAEVARLNEIVAEVQTAGFHELSESHLAMIGGGVGEVVLA